MDIASVNDALGLVLSGGAVIALLAGYFRWVHPKWRRAKADVVAARDALLGRDAIIDSITGEESVPALPGMGKRMALQEKTLTDLTVTVAQLAEVVAHQSRLDQIVEGHEGRISALEQAAVERVVTKAEATAAWRAMEAATNATPDPGHSDT